MSALVIPPPMCSNALRSQQMEEPCLGRTEIASSTFRNRSDITNDISQALTLEDYNQAIAMLRSMYHTNQRPDMEARWRWFRIVNASTGLSQQMRGLPKRSPKAELMLQVVDAMLRLVGPFDSSVCWSSEKTVMVSMEPWDVRCKSDKNSIPACEGFLDNAVRIDHLKSQFRIALEIPGLERDRPSLSPARYWTSTDNAVALDPNAPSPIHHMHPVVPNLHCLKAVFQPEECIQIIAAAQANGFDPDIPIHADGLKLDTVAWYFYWVIDQAFEAKLWARMAPFVPKEFNGKAVRGVNRWFRIYRYIPGREFPAHIDGAWPPSSIHAETGGYIADASPESAKQMSMFTFLTYLSDNFGPGGETTFFLPSSTEGRLHAYPVKPMQGNVLIFPHGELDEALYHEGTTHFAAPGKTPKYVIRSEIIYDA